MRGLGFYSLVPSLKGVKAELNEREVLWRPRQWTLQSCQREVRGCLPRNGGLCLQLSMIRSDDKRLLK